MCFGEHAQAECGGGTLETPSNVRERSKLGSCLAAFVFFFAGVVAQSPHESVAADSPGKSVTSKGTPVADQPWENTLGMKFVPISGTNVLFSVWETRVQDFEEFVRATNYDAIKGMLSNREDGWRPHGDSWKSPGFPQTPQHPVCGVSWEDARAFCVWLTEKERAAGRLASNQLYRLPTDEEWSAAVGLPRENGGTPKERNGKMGEVYWWGKDFPPPKGVGNFPDESAKRGRHADWTTIVGYDDGFEDSSPVGTFSATKSGLYDLTGNLWEWCEDFFDGKAGARVLRGGAYSRLGAHHLESSFRLDVAPGRRRGDFGFRCVIELVAAAP
jgi:formylglycine-generating enzyme required for sulfatase activity